MTKPEGGPIAVDVVLLPDPSVQRRAININRYLVSHYESEIRLDSGNCLPHISLAMGCLAPRDLDALGERLAAIATEHPITTYPIDGVVTRESGSFGMASALQLEARDELQRLHSSVMRAASPFFKYDITPEMLTGEDPVSESTLSWIRSYAESSSFERFWPHITLGYGNAKGQSAPKAVRPTHLAVCHLGNHCTCRKVLLSLPLRAGMRG